MSEVQLRVRDLWKTFHPGLFESDVEVLKGLSLEVFKGEIFGFLGPNGAGKTTTIKSITGLVIPDAGDITIGGHPHTSLEGKRRIGFMAEHPYLYNHLTGREYLVFSAELLGIDGAEIPGRVSAVLDQVSMARRADQKMRTYSKGMAQRVALGQAVLGEPELLILDEPMSGLDPIGRRDVRDLILGQQQRGATVFFSSHIIPDVETICDRVATVIDGSIRGVGAVPELLALEVERYELTFSGVDPSTLKTAITSSHRGSDATWALVESGQRDALIAELAERGARLISLTPVRRTLEDFLMDQFREEVGS